MLILDLRGSSTPFCVQADNLYDYVRKNVLSFINICVSTLQQHVNLP